MLLYIFAFTLSWFPIFGGYDAGTFPEWSVSFILNILKHSFLPALSIVLAGIGFWALGMRAMMVTMQGEDYMVQADALGLKDRRIFWKYAVRNAILPQSTAFALSLGHVVSGAVLVEVIFGYPGIGSLLVPRHTRIRLLRHFRDRVDSHRRHCAGHDDHRPCLPLDRPAHHLREGITMALAVERSGLSIERYLSGNTLLTYRYMRRNPLLLGGLAILLALFLFWAVGSLIVSPEETKPLAAIPRQKPSMEYPLGTDEVGRNIFAVMVSGTALTLRIGLIAGAVGLAIGAIIAFMAGYYGGVVDTVIRGTVDTLQTVPQLLILIIIAASVRSGLNVDQMALIIATLAWITPARTIRAQVLTLRERTYIDIARQSGMSGLEIIFKELMPNLMPYMVASFVLAVASAILASIGLEALGLGPLESPTLGMTIYWNIYFGSLLLGLWWWWAPPIIIIVLLFVGLFLVTAGLDEWANPRLRRRV